MKRPVLLLALLLWPLAASAQIVSPGGSAGSSIAGGTCTTPQFMQGISGVGVPVCATPSGGAGYPSGGPPQIGGFSATNTSEAETVSGDLSLTRAGANSYTATVLKVNGLTPGGTCTGGNFVSSINSSGVPTCTAPSAGLPNGAPPQFIGYSATNVGEAETLGGDSTVTRTGANAYTMINTGLHFGTANAVALPGTAPTSGGIPYFSSASALASSTALTLNAPVLGGGAGGSPTTGTRSGNTTIFATSTGTLTSGDCAKWDANGNVVDAGAVCSSGFTAGGDLSGTSTSQTVVGIRSTSVPAPTAGYLHYNGTAFLWDTPAGSGGGGYPTGAAPQITGYDASNNPEAETLSGDATLARAGANSYTITVTKTGGTAFGALATAAVPLSIVNGGSGSATVPSAGQILVAQSASAFAPVTMSGDCTIGGTGAITCTKTSGTPLSAIATAASPLPVVNGGSGSATAPTAGQIEVAQSATAFAPVTMSGDATISSAGAITVTKTSGTAFTALATAAVPLSIANGGEGSSTAPTAGQIRVAASGTSFPPVTMSGAATITSAGVVSLTTPVTLTGTTSTVGFDFGGPVVSNTISAFTCVIPLTIPANFASPNTVLTCGGNPSESDAYTVKVNGATVGTLTISTTCVITRGSSSSTTCAAGQRMEIDAPVTVSGSDVAISIGVTR